jgi:Protein of unknown function (DUF4056)
VGPIRQRVNRALLPLTLATCTTLACATPQLWHVQEEPTRDDVAALLGAGGSMGIHSEFMPSEIPPVPARSRLRPCCAFGSNLKAKIGFIPVPGYEIPNILGPDDVGTHRYDSGVLRIEPHGKGALELNDENNGLVYTCRGGFIDTAHVRDYADWSIYAAGRVARILMTGEAGEFTLPAEGGERRVLIAKVDPDQLELIGIRRLAGWLGAYTAWYTAVWHEVATWYGFRVVPGFSEKASAFSIEDNYSNALGAKLATALVDRGLTRSENVFNRSLDEWLAGALAHLEAVPSEVGGEAAEAVDGLWWDSTKRLPDSHLVMRRNVDHLFPLKPWLIPTDRMPDSLREACGDDPEVSLIETKPEFRWIPELVTLEIVVDEDFLDQKPFTEMGGTVTQRDFPRITEEVRHQIRAELGPEADRRE